MIVSVAEREGIKPDLLIYITLAEMDGGRAGTDLLATARHALSARSVLSLKATFGDGTADSILIIVAAYEMGIGRRGSYLLLAKMRKVIKTVH